MSIVDQTVAARSIPPRDMRTLAGLVGAYLDDQLDAFTRAEAMVPDDTDAVHDTRVAIRRYRSVLRVLESAFHPGRARPLAGELAWFAAALGEVRDRQMLRAHLDTLLAAVAAEATALTVAPVRRRIHITLDAELASATTEVRILMRSPREPRDRAARLARRAAHGIGRPGRPGR